MEELIKLIDEFNQEDLVEVPMETGAGYLEALFDNEESVSLATTASSGKSNNRTTVDESGPRTAITPPTCATSSSAAWSIDAASLSSSRSSESSGSNCASSFGSSSSDSGFEQMTEDEDQSVLMAADEVRNTMETLNISHSKYYIAIPTK